jgi:hypothetical protein
VLGQTTIDRTVSADVVADAVDKIPHDVSG